MRKRERGVKKDPSTFIDAADQTPAETAPVVEKARREPRKYKSITLHMNRAEYEQLEALAIELDRSMLSTIRHAITQLAKNSDI